VGEAMLISSNARTVVFIPVGNAWRGMPGLVPHIQNVFMGRFANKKLQIKMENLYGK